MIGNRGARRTRASVAAVFAVMAVGAGACSSSSPHVGAPELLTKARDTANAATAVHFVLTSQNVALSGTNLTGGEGDLVRPNGLQGTFKVAVSGFTASVAVVSLGSVFEAKLPFSTHFQKTDPSNFGLTNPAELLDPNAGLTRLLTLAQNPTLGPNVRSGGELLETVTYTVPGADVPVLPDADPSKPVTLTVAINPSNFQMRSITLVGPLTSATSNSTYKVTLSNYNEHVTITLPSTS